MSALAIKWRDYMQLMRLHKPIGIYLLLWPTLWGLWFAASGVPDLLILFVFVAGVTLMRSAGCVVNDFADRDIDPHVERTRDRPIAAGRVSSREALLLFAGLSLLAFALVLLLNGLTIALSFVGAFLAASYPFMKRYTHLPQFYLGAAFAWAVPMGFAAQTGEVPALAWLLFLAPVFWAVAYDTMYAMVDRDDDLKIGVKSTAILFGQWDRFWVGVFQVLTLAVLAIAGFWTERGVLYWLSLGVFSGFSVYQQILIRKRERGPCFVAFLNNHWAGLAVFTGLVLDYALK
ncbi:MAG: 4-hydroxybenzoate octaprenyltransferase [Gammaproteobacteria bacterium]